MAYRAVCSCCDYFRIDHFTVVCLVAWPLNENEAGVDLVLIETFLLLISYVNVAVLMLISNNYLH